MKRSYAPFGERVFRGDAPRPADTAIDAAEPAWVKPFVAIANGIAGLVLAASIGGLLALWQS